MNKRFRTLAYMIVVLALAVAATACGPRTPAERVEQAKVLIDKGQLPAARIELANALQENANLLEARWLMAQVAVDLGDGATAEKEIRRAVELGLDPAQAQLLLVRSIMLQGDLQRVLAETHLVAAGVPDADRAAILGMRGQAYAERREFEEADYTLQEALELDPRSVPALIGMAVRNALQRDYDAARDWVGKALEVDPESADALSVLGQIELEQGNAAEAEAALTKAIDRRNYFGMELAKRALARVQLQKYAQADADLTQLKKAGLFEQPYVSYVAGVSAFAQKKYAEAAEAFETSKQAMPEPYLPREYYLASTYLALGRLEQARSQAELINRLTPRSTTAKRLLGTVQISQSELEAATKLLSDAIRNSPDDIPMLRMLGHVSLLLGNTKDGVRYYEQALAVEPDSAQIQDALALAKLMDGQSLDMQSASALTDDASSFTRELLAALAQFRDGKLGDALAQARALNARYPDSVEPLKLMAACYLAAGQWEQGREQLEAVLQKKPGEPSALKNLVRLDLMDGQSERAVERLEELLKERPTDADAQVQLARIREQADGAAAAIPGLEQALERTPDALPVRAELVRLHAASGNPQRVIEVTRVLSDEEFRRMPTLLEQQGKAQLAVGDAPGAQRSFAQLVQLFPDSAPAHFVYSESLIRGGRKNEAVSELQRSLELDQGYLPARVAEVRLKVLDNDIDAARERLSALRQTFGDRSEVLDTEGWFALGVGDYATAAARYAELQARSPSAATLVLHARALYALRKLDEANSGLESWLKQHPQDVGVQLELASAYLAQGREADARVLYARIVEVQPENVLALNNLAWLGRDSDPKASIAHAERALELAPQNASVMDTLGMLLLKGPDGKRGRRLIEQAAGLAPEEAGIQVHWAQLLADEGRPEEARQVLQSAIDKAGDTPAAVEARTLLQRLQ